MYRLNCKFTTDAGTLDGGSVVDKKQLKKHFSQDEIDGYVDDGLICELDVPEATTSKTSSNDDMTLEQMLEAPKETLKSAQLNAVCKSYGLSTANNMDTRIERINAFETLLDADLEEEEFEDVKLVAAYYDVDLTLDKDAMIAAIEVAGE